MEREADSEIDKVGRYTFIKRSIYIHENQSLQSSRKQNVFLHVHPAIVLPPHPHALTPFA